MIVGIVHLSDIVEAGFEVVRTLAAVGYSLPEVDGVLELHEVDRRVEAIHADRIVVEAVALMAWTILDMIIRDIESPIINIVLVFFIVSE